MLIAGTIADIDLLSAYFGPSAFLTFYRTYCHSLLAALLWTGLPTPIFGLWEFFSPEFSSPRSAGWSQRKSAQDQKARAAKWAHPLRSLGCFFMSFCVSFFTAMLYRPWSLALTPANCLARPLRLSNWFRLSAGTVLFNPTALFMML